MIRVLIMASDSLLAQFIESALSQETDLDVFRVTRDELGLRRDYSVVIVVDDGMSESESIKLKEIARDDVRRILIRVSVASKIVYVDESHQLNNPEMEELVELVRDFGRRNLREGSQDDRDLQKKMNSIIEVQAGKYNRQQTHFSSGRLFALTQVIKFHDQIAGKEAPGGYSHQEMPMIFYSFFLHYLRLKNPGNMTLPIWQDHLTGINQ